MPDSCTRVKRVVRTWAQVAADVPISTAKVLFNVWLQTGSGLPYCNAAVGDLINRIEAEFPELKIRLNTSDFCPPEPAAVKAVGDLCSAVAQAEIK